MQEWKKSLILFVLAVITLMVLLLSLMKFNNGYVAIVSFIGFIISFGMWMAESE